MPRRCRLPMQARPNPCAGSSTNANVSREHIPRAPRTRPCRNTRMPCAISTRGSSFPCGMNAAEYVQTARVRKAISRSSAYGRVGGKAACGGDEQVAQMDLHELRQRGSSWVLILVAQTTPSNHGYRRVWADSRITHKS